MAAPGGYGPSQVPSPADTLGTGGAPSPVGSVRSAFVRLATGSPNMHSKQQPIVQQPTTQHPHPDMGDAVVQGTEPAQGQPRQEDEGDALVQNMDQFVEQQPAQQPEQQSGQHQEQSPGIDRERDRQRDAHRDFVRFDPQRLIFERHYFIPDPENVPAQDPEQFSGIDPERDRQRDTHREFVRFDPQRLIFERHYFIPDPENVPVQDPEQFPGIDRERVMERDKQRDRQRGVERVRREQDLMRVEENVAMQDPKHTPEDPSMQHLEN